MAKYIFDGTMTGLLCCVFRAFQFKDLDVVVVSHKSTQSSLFDETIFVESNDMHADRVWKALKQKVSSNTLRNIYYTFLAEQESAFQHLFNLCIYIFSSTKSVDGDYGHPDVLAVSKWAKQVRREKHHMEAFVRFKKCRDELFYPVPFFRLYMSYSYYLHAQQNRLTHCLYI